MSLMPNQLLEVLQKSVEKKLGIEIDKRDLRAILREEVDRRIKERVLTNIAGFDTNTIKQMGRGESGMHHPKVRKKKSDLSK